MASVKSQICVCNALPGSLDVTLSLSYFCLKGLIVLDVLRVGTFSSRLAMVELAVESFNTCNIVVQDCPET